MVGLTTQGYSMSSELKMVSSKIILPGGQGIPHSIIILRVMVLCIAKTVLWLEDPMKGMSMSSINDLNEEKKDYSLWKAMICPQYGNMGSGVFKWGVQN